jgi:nitronate monooxygenase
MWASQAIGLIADLPPAADLVAALAAQAVDALAKAAGRAADAGSLAWQP